MGNQKKKTNTWKYIREQGFADYVKSKMLTFGIMMAVVYIINVLFSEDMNYILTAVIYIVLVILAPILSWKFNEWNYKSDSELEDAE